MLQEASDSEYVVFYDGDCGLCHRAVRFIIDRDPEGRFRFAPLQSDLADRTLSPRGLNSRTINSLVLVRSRPDALPEVSLRSTAAIQIGLRLKGPVRPIAWVGRAIPTLLRDLLYRAVASLRRRLAKPPQCSVPTKAERARFLAE